MFDWEREAVSADPEYYKWTEWFFAQLFKHGLAYKKMSPVDWCPNCNTTLAREQVWGEDRHCERCGTPVIKKNLDQWYFRITKYADELLSFEGIDWPERVKTLQTNWIGKSEGAHVVFHSEQEDPIEVFTTRPDTLWGATFMVLAPEHPLAAAVAEKRPEVADYIRQAMRKKDWERVAAGDKEHWRCCEVTLAASCAPLTSARKSRSRAGSTATAIMAAGCSSICAIDTARLRSCSAPKVAPKTRSWPARCAASSWSR